MDSEYVGLSMTAMKNRWTMISRVLAVLLMVFTLLVSVPLSISTFREGGGPWGFGLIGLNILLPLNAYLLFSISAFLREKPRRFLFIVTHIVSLALGITGAFIFPFFPKGMLMIPVVLAITCIIDRKHLTTYLIILITLAIVANLLLLKWEIDFGRTIPIVELFHSSPNRELR